MDSLTEIYKAIENEVEDQPIPRARYPEKYIAHKTDIGRLVYEALGKDAAPLVYAEVNKFASEMLSRSFAWWYIEFRIKAVLQWAHKVGANHAGIRTTFKKVLAEDKS